MGFTGYIGHAIGLFFWGVMGLTKGIEEGRTSDHSSFITSTGCRVQAARQNTTKSPCLGRCSNVPLAATWYVEAKKRAPSPHTNLDPIGPGGGGCLGVAFSQISMNMPRVVGLVL